VVGDVTVFESAALTRGPEDLAVTRSASTAISTDPSWSVRKTCAPWALSLPIVAGAG
jgi:hypothetical protein